MVNKGVSVHPPFYGKGAYGGKGGPVAVIGGKGILTDPAAGLGIYGGYGPPISFQHNSFHG